jgi:hypothetical protein
MLAACAALLALAFIAKSVLLSSNSIQAVIDPTPVSRTVDLIAPVVAPIPSADFKVDRDGRTQGYMDLLLPGNRTMRIAPGTYGEVSCTELDQFNRCAVLADVLGDAVVWFALLPLATAGTVEVGPIVDLQAGKAVFENGWRIPYAPVIKRECGDIDIPSFRDFLRRFGPGSTTIVDLNAQQVTAVRCPTTDQSP